MSSDFFSESESCYMRKPDLMALSAIAAVLLFSGELRAEDDKPWTPGEFASFICDSDRNFGSSDEERLIAGLKGGQKIPRDCPHGEAGFTALVRRSRNPALFQAALDSGADPDYAPRGGYSARMAAFGTKKLDAAMPFITAGKCDPGQKVPDGDTLLIETMFNDDRQVFHEVMKRGCSSGNIDARGRKGESALMLLAMRVFAPDHGKKAEILNLFKKYGADFNQMSRQGRPLIQEASLGGSRTELKYDDAILDGILAGGADIAARNSKGESLLNFLMHYDPSERFLKKLLELKPDLNARDDLGNTPALAAYEYISGSRSRIGDRDHLVKILAEAGADLNAVNKRGVNILTAAIMAGAVRGTATGLTEYFLEKGVKLQEKTPEGAGLLFYAGPAGLKSGAVKALINAGADVNEQESETGMTPLMTAAFAGNRAALEAFTAAGARVDARDHEGRTALMALTLAAPAADTIAVLLRAGASPGLRDKNGLTARDYLRRSELSENEKKKQEFTWIDELLRKAEEQENSGKAEKTSGQ